MTKLANLDRKKFVQLKKEFVHPSTEVSQPGQLIGRDGSLNLVRNALEREGSNVFIWGRRGVGKTSLAHTAINKFNDLVCQGPAIACEPTSTVDQLFNDIIRRSAKARPSFFKDGKIKLKLGALGLGLEGEYSTGINNVHVSSVNHASELLDAIFPADFEGGRYSAVIVDEFDQLGNKETIGFLTALAKQMSVDQSNVKFIFCGVAENLEALIGSHESVGRYLTAVKLDPLSDDQIWRISEGIASNFGVKLGRGHTIRIGQIACGYPTFAHLIVDEILNVAYEGRFSGSEISQDIFNEAMRRAAAGAATHLQGAYETATQKGTDRYVEVLWAAANGPHIGERQFKEISADYHRIMATRKSRDEITNEQNLRNHLNALCEPSHAEVLKKRTQGWYRFSDPMFRGYVRMMAYNSSVELGDESFQR